MPVPRRSIASQRARSVLTVTFAVIALSAAACGDDEPEPVDIEPSTVGDAIASPDGSAVSVQGSLFDDGAGLVVCDALAESFPPQCPGLSLAILNPDDVPAEITSGLTTEGGVRWSDRPVVLDGVINQGTLEVRS